VRKYQLQGSKKASIHAGRPGEIEKTTEPAAKPMNNYMGQVTSYIAKLASQPINLPSICGDEGLKDLEHESHC